MLGVSRTLLGLKNREVTHNIVERLRAALAAQPVEQPLPEAVRAAMDGLVPEGSDQYQQVVARMRLLNQLPELRPALSP